MSSLDIEKKIEEKFQIFGEISSVEFKNKATSDSTGHCIIKFVDPESVSRALSAKIHYLEGKVLECRPVLEGEALERTLQEFDSMRLFLRNIPKSATEEDVVSEFEQLGIRIKNFYIVETRSRGKRRNTNIGFLTVFDREDAQKLVDHKNVKIGKKTLTIMRYRRKRDLIREKEAKKKAQILEEQNSGQRGIGASEGLGEQDDRVRSIGGGVDAQSVASGSNLSSDGTTLGQDGSQLGNNFSDDSQELAPMGMFQRKDRGEYVSATQLNPEIFKKTSKFGRNRGRQNQRNQGRFFNSAGLFTSQEFNYQNQKPTEAVYHSNRVIEFVKIRSSKKTKNLKFRPSEGAYESPLAGLGSWRKSGR